MYNIAVTLRNNPNNIVIGLPTVSERNKVMSYISSMMRKPDVIVITDEYDNVLVCLDAAEVVAVKVLLPF